MAVVNSLFDTSATSPLTSASDWVTGTLFGGLAFGLCVIAVASVGLLMMTGRLAVRDAARVVIGCFILLGASTIAVGLRGVADIGGPNTTLMEPFVKAPPAPPPQLPPANFDPYAGASLRVE